MSEVSVTAGNVCPACPGIQANLALVKEHFRQIAARQFKFLFGRHPVGVRRHPKRYPDDALVAGDVGNPPFEAVLDHLAQPPDVFGFSLGVGNINHRAKLRSQGSCENFSDGSYLIFLHSGDAQLNRHTQPHREAKPTVTFDN